MRIIFFLFMLSLTSYVEAQNKKYHFIYEELIPNQERFDKMDLVGYNAVDKIKLYGTLLLPKTTFNKVVMIIPGSGPDSRENHFQLAEELLLNDIAVFRFDERGLSESEGTYNEAGTTINQMVEDMASLFQKLREVPALKGKQLGVIGHSLGGTIVIDAVNKKKIDPDFMVQWATPIQSFGEWFKYLLKNDVSGISEQFKYDNIEDAYKIMDIFNKGIAEMNESNTIKEDLVLLKKVRKVAEEQGYTKKRYDRFRYATFPSERAIIKKDFEKMYAALQVPTLYVIGTQDKAVDPVAVKETLDGIANKNIALQVFDGLDHYLTDELNKPDTDTERYYMDLTAKAYLVHWIKEF